MIIQLKTAPTPNLISDQKKPHHHNEHHPEHTTIANNAGADHAPDAPFRVRMEASSQVGHDRVKASAPARRARFARPRTPRESGWVGGWQREPGRGRLVIMAA